MHRPARLVSGVLLAALAVFITVLPGDPRATSRAAGTPEFARNDSVRPPLTPRWVYEPWIWEDEENDADAVIELVDDYQERGIPVGVVIIDSPWQTNYNTYVFGSNYPDPARLMADLRARNVRVILWATAMINVSSLDGPGRGESPLYSEAVNAGYLVNRGQTVTWDKGVGAAVDFFNPDAVAWWYRQLDKAWAYGIDGWKVDSPEGNLPDIVQTAAGPRTNREYGDAYYRAYYRYVAERSPDAVIMARPIDGGTRYAPVEANPAGWVGDQNPEWGGNGIGEALDNILASAEAGYAVLGSDIGGYRPGERFDRLFIRWTQLGALSPLMENGGRGEHRPWKLDRDGDVATIYRYYARLHRELVPYLYGLGVEAHRTGVPIIRNGDRERQQYWLGDDLLVAPIVRRDERREVDIPAGDRWLDYWNDGHVYEGPARVTYKASLERIPLFFRSGAIIPLDVVDSETGHGGQGSAGATTLLVYPDGESRRTFHPDAEHDVTITSTQRTDGLTLTIDPWSETWVVRFKEVREPSGVTLTVGGQETALPELASFDRFDGAGAGWYRDVAGGYIWARFQTSDASGTPAILSVSTEADSGS
ncbi:MAG: hypothetical protein IT305_08340 [Chloroflexi bacterium]|nr:hypothetical protein [Chloroflexota bacterium]